MSLESHAATLNAISDHKSLLVFKTIAMTSPDSNSLRRKSKLTRKQYYTRISRLIRAGLIKKRNGKYFLTAYGKIIYDAQKIIENAHSNYWKLKAIDSLEVSDDENSIKERRKIIDTLIEDKGIKESLLAKSMR
jgi:predicted transcriptional regulator